MPLFILLLTQISTARAQSLPPIILDAHCDILLRILDDGDNLDGKIFGRHHADIPLWRAGGMNAVFFSVWVDPRRYPRDEAVKRAWDLINAYQEQARKFPNDIEKCDTARGTRLACVNGKIAALLGIEGGCAINNDLSLIAKFRAAGVRYMTLTWRGNLRWAGSANPRDFETTFGLSLFGEEVVREMNRVGMVVDLSHVSDATFYDALGITDKPVFVTHSNCRALAPNARNVSDDMLRALAANGGVIGVNFYRDFLVANERAPGSREPTTATLETVLDHIDHMVQIAGIDHVGIGTDWEGMDDPAIGLENASKMPDLIAGLRRRKYSEADIRKIAADNFLRVLDLNERPPADASLLN